jgi:hypothetical protein
MQRCVAKQLSTCILKGFFAKAWLHVDYHIITSKSMSQPTLMFGIVLSTIELEDFEIKNI